MQVFLRVLCLTALAFSLFVVSAQAYRPDFRLFVRTNETHCAEDLPYGPDIDLEATTGAGFVTREATNVTSRLWVQVFQSDVANFTIIYKWNSTLSLKDRFEVASVNGLNVSYGVITKESGKLITYDPEWTTWWFSTGFNNGGGKRSTESGDTSASSSATRGGVAPSDRLDGISSDTCCFSGDDGLWGAGPAPALDANEEEGACLSEFQEQSWGHENCNGGEDGCATVVHGTNSTATASFVVSTVAMLADDPDCPLEDVEYLNGPCPAGALADGHCTCPYDEVNGPCVHLKFPDSCQTGGAASTLVSPLSAFYHSLW